MAKKKKDAETTEPKTEEQQPEETQEETEATKEMETTEESAPLAENNHSDDDDLSPPEGEPILIERYQDTLRCKNTREVELQIRREIENVAKDIDHEEADLDYLTTRYKADKAEKTERIEKLKSRQRELREDANLGRKDKVEVVKNGYLEAEMITRVRTDTNEIIEKRAMNYDEKKKARSPELGLVIPMKKQEEDGSGEKSDLDNLRERVALRDAEDSYDVLLEANTEAEEVIGSFAIAEPEGEIYIFLGESPEQTHTIAIESSIEDAKESAVGIILQEYLENVEKPTAQGYDDDLYTLLNMHAESDKTWNALKNGPIDDETLQIAISEAFGDGCSLKREDGAEIHATGGDNPRFQWGEISILGPKLLREVRRLVGIAAPQPIEQETTEETDNQAEADGARA